MAFIGISEIMGNLSAKGFELLADGEFGHVGDFTGGPIPHLYTFRLTRDP